MTDPSAFTSLVPHSTASTIMWTQLRGFVRPKRACVPGHAHYQKGEKLQLRVIDKAENVTGTCDAPSTQQADCDLPSDFCESDRCVYQDTWTPVGECQPIPIAGCDPSDPTTYRKGIQMKTRQLVENCDYCGPCPSQETTNDECTVPEAFCDCETYGTWSTWTPADCESLPWEETTTLQSRTFNVSPGKSLPYGCPANETRVCPIVECPADCVYNPGKGGDPRICFARKL